MPAVLRVYSVSVLPMANKDGVARGGTRFNLRGKDLNRDWDKPANAELAPENAALETWLEAGIARADGLTWRSSCTTTGTGASTSAGRRSGARSSSRANGDLRGAAPEHTWFTEGPTNAEFRNSGTLGDGWLQRYGIDAAVHQLNCNWVEG